MKRIYLTYVLIFISGYALQAQTEDTKKADKHFRQHEFNKAIEEYMDIVKDGEADTYVYRQLGQAYYNLSQPEKALAYYEEVVKSENATADDYYLYAQLLKIAGKPEASNTWMRKFAQAAPPNDSRARNFLQNPNYLKDLKTRPAAYSISPVGFNSDYSDFGGHIFDGRLYFVSARDKSGKTFEWTGRPTLDIYVVGEQAGMFTSPQPLEGDVNSGYNEGTVSITEEGTTMYFSRNHYLDGDYEEDEKGISILKVYSAKLTAGEWQQIKLLPFNKKGYSSAHVALSPDGNTLYFSSNMPGGFGQSDLYKVEIKDDGSFGKPQNLGDNINTEGRESFPFISEEGTIYFSSDGHLGLGGLDVFYAEPQGDGFGAVKNMGTPVNSSADDFAFTYYPSKKVGFVSSNRQELQNDDIYRISPIEKCKREIIVTVVDAETDEPIENARVTLYSLGGNSAGLKSTNQKGMTNFTMMPCDSYEIQADAEGYFSNTAVVEKGKDKAIVEIRLSPEPVITETEVILNPIYFEFDKANITPQAATELDRLVRVMKEHPEMKIQVRSHTDYIGTDAYNLDLSNRRAKSTVEYIISQGIDASRITGKGFGESMPEIPCGTNCTDEQRAKNRRSEFMIIGGDVEEKK